MPQCTGRAPLLGAALLALLLTSCSDDLPFSLDGEVGVVEGYVTMAGEPVATDVVAECRDEDLTNNTVTVASGVDGHYRLELPSGHWRIAAEGDGVLRSWDYDDQSAVVEVGPVTRRHDLTYGLVEGALRLPASAEGRGIGLELTNDVGSRLLVDAEVVDGAAFYRIPLVPAGRYELSLDSDRFSRPIWKDIEVPCSTVHLDSTVFAVGVDTIVRHDFDFTVVMATVAGHMVGAWEEAGSTPPGLELINERNRVVTVGSADESGNFSLPLLIPCTVRLRANSGWNTIYHGGWDQATAEPIVTEPGAEVTGVSLVSAGIKARLHGPGDLSDHGRVNVLVIDESGTEVLDWGTYDSSYPFLMLPPGRFRVRVSGQCSRASWLPQWWGGVESAAEATPIDFEPDRLEILDFALTAGGSLSGEVTWPDGGRPEFLRILVADPTGEPLDCDGSFYGAWFSSHRFMLEGLADGDYLLAAGADHADADWWYPGTADPDSAQVVSVRYHAAVSGLNWTLPAREEER